jgi:hypothetical protein
VEPANDHREPGGPELAAKVQRARKLVGLYPDQCNETRPGRTDFPDRTLYVDDRIALVVGVDFDLDIRPEDFLGRTLAQQSIDAR